MSRVRDNLIGSGNSGSEVNGKIEQFTVNDGNNINAGDMVKFINSEIVKDTKEVEKEYIEEEIIPEEYMYNIPSFPNKDISLSTDIMPIQPLVIGNYIVLSNGKVLLYDRYYESIESSANITLSNNYNISFSNIKSVNTDDIKNNNIILSNANQFNIFKFPLLVLIGR